MFPNCLGYFGNHSCYDKANISEFSLTYQSTTLDETVGPFIFSESGGYWNTSDDELVLPIAKFTDEEFFIRTMGRTNQTKGENLMIGPIEVRVDGPAVMGCYKVLDINDFGPQTISASLTRAQCILQCKGQGKRISGVMFGVKCFCIDKFPRLSALPVQSDKCTTPCSGDDQHFCGGTDSITLMVVECEAGWTRFGDGCFKADQATMQMDAQDRCLRMGANLWYPETRHELQWVSRIVGAGSEFFHIGFRSYHHKKGFLLSDYSKILGIPFVTHTNGKEPTNDTKAFETPDPDSCWWWNSTETGSLVYNTTKCSDNDVMNICKKPLMEGFGYFQLIEEKNVPFKTMSTRRNRTLEGQISPLPGPGFTWASLPEEFPNGKYLDIDFAEQVVAAAVVITTTNTTYLKSFRIRAATDLNNPWGLSHWYNIMDYPDTEVDNLEE